MWNVSQGLIAFFIVVCFLALSKLFNLELVDTESKSKYKLPAIESEVINEESGQAYEQILAAYETLQPEEKNKDQANDISESQQQNNQQQAKVAKPKILKPQFQLFDEKSQIGLVGIFREEQTVAVLQRVNFDTEKVEYDRLVEGQQLGPYTLTKIDKLTVTLQSANKTLNLMLFKGRNS